jgi:hypothetical protein
MGDAGFSARRESKIDYTEGTSMRILWTLAKVILALAIAIPLGLLAVGLSIGILGGLFGLAVLALRLAVVGFVGYGAFVLARRLFWSAPKHTPQPMRELPTRDPYYEAAMRELDAEMRHTSR